MKQDNSMAKYILSILNSQKLIFWSWGPSKLYSITNGLMFHVQGFKFRGFVRVLYNSMLDLFDITFVQDKTHKETKEEGIFFDQLVEVIDEYVEKTDNYKEKVNEFFAQTIAG